LLRKWNRVNAHDLEKLEEKREEEETRAEDGPVAILDQNARELVRWEAEEMVGEAGFAGAAEESGCVKSFGESDGVDGEGAKARRSRSSKEAAGAKTLLHLNLTISSGTEHLWSEI
jgi:hypothetical protein